VPIKLADAIANAVLTYPEIKISQARAREAKAGVNIARAALYPSADLRLATGLNFAGSYEGQTVPYKTSTNTIDGRTDGGIILRQLVYDFGATRSDIERAELLRDAERLKVREKIDEIAYKTTQSYLKVLEQRALVALVDEIIGAHEHLARVVQAHAKEGHGTIADVQRVNSRLVDVRAIRSDVTLQLKAAEDQFERLTRYRPNRLIAPPDVRRALPGSPANAITQMLANNPRLAALQSTAQSSRKELESQRAGVLPKINLEVESESKNFRNGPSGRSQGEARAMLSMRYRLMDGGLSAATEQQILARIEGGEFGYINEREQLEADIRQAYRAIDSAGRKLKLISEGVTSATKVRELYLEQFKGGKRTVFELLDSQMSYYTIRRNQIENQFEGQRATFDILRATGSLTAVLSRPI
jgi:outer membrane protein, adhesin transport system